jgi:hypothetical protein
MQNLLCMQGTYEHIFLFKVLQMCMLQHTCFFPRKSYFLRVQRDENEYRKEIQVDRDKHLPVL